MKIITQGKTNWKFLLIVVILAAVAGGGVLWCKTRQEISPSPDIKISRASDETADRKTYRNEEYGFEIKYPSNYLYQENSYQPRVNMVYFFPPENKSEFGFDPEIFVSVDKEPQTLFFHGTFVTISRSEAASSTGISLISSEDIIINNIVWKKESWRLFNDLNPVTFYTKRRNSYYSISLGQKLDQKEATLNQMLSSFKFVE